MASPSNSTLNVELEVINHHTLCRCAQDSYQHVAASEPSMPGNQWVDLNATLKSTAKQVWSLVEDRRYVQALELVSPGWFCAHMANMKNGFTGTLKRMLEVYLTPKQTRVEWPSWE